MDYDELVTKVIELLQREKRVPYRALKRRFDLDDEYIEDLKVEIIQAKRLAVDEDGTILVWTGDAQAVASQSEQTPQQPAAQATQPTHEPLLESRPREAERRQLTVMFCDLVDSTKLSSHLDPEDYREVVRAYQAACTEVIQRYDGHVAQLLGDGLLVYFGYPVAHEEDAQRAIHTGLGIVEAIGYLNTHLEQAKGIKLAVRLGVHTGLVVVGEMGGEGRQEQLALGETPNVAARLQGFADPDTVVISEATYRLIQGYFDCQELGERVLRGASHPVPIYQVFQESGVQSRLDVASTRGLTPLVGRESEVTLLLERWQQAKDGQGQVILLSGEAGIGKSRLVQVLKDHLADEPHTRWECRSSPYYQNTALYPITDLLQRALPWHQDDTSEQHLEKLEHLLSQYRLPLEETVPLFAPILSLAVPDDTYPPLNLSPQRQRQKTLESIVAILLELAEGEPVLFILEDLHWTDPTTLEFLSLLVEQVPAASIYTLLTCRPHFQPAWHHRSYITEMTLNHLSHTQVEQIVTCVTDGKTLPKVVIQQIIEKTDGIPLFVEEMTKAILESGPLKEVEGYYELTGSFSTFAIPATLQDSLMARLDRLVTAKAVAQYAAVIGRQFAYPLLQGVSQLDDTTLQRELGRLVEAEIVYQRGIPPQSTYAFKHALIQDAAYESLLKSTRQHYHQRIAQVLETQFPATVGTQPELLAHHYTEAGLDAQAVGYWKQAGQRAAVRSAYREAISHITTGLDILKNLPDSPVRMQDELALHIVLGESLQIVQGFSALEAGQVYKRAHTLCQQVGDTSQRIHILLGLRAFHHVGGDLHTARQIGQELLSLFDHAQEPALILQIHHAIGHTLYYLGEFEAARGHLEQGTGIHSFYGNRLVLSWALWYLGFPEQARIQIQAELALTAQHDDPRSVESVFSSAAILYQLRGEGGLAQACIERAMSVATEKGFQFRMAWDALIRGWICSEQGQWIQGIDEMCRGLSAYSTTGAQVSRPWFLSLLATLYGKTGAWEKAQQSLSDAMVEMSGVGSRFYEAEVYRLRGALVLASPLDDYTEAESCFHQAISIAQRQQVKSLELRATTSLAKLWQRQGKRQEAYDLLAPVYGWFTEGFDTLDLIEAKALLDELAEEIPREA